MAHALSTKQQQDAFCDAVMELTRGVSVALEPAVNLESAWQVVPTYDTPRVYQPQVMVHDGEVRRCLPDVVRMAADKINDPPPAMGDEA